MASLLKNTGGQNITFTLVNATTGAALTSATFTSLAWVTKDNTQAGFAGTFTTLGNGQFNYAPTQSETNCTDFGLLITVAGAVPVNLDFHTDSSAPLTGAQIATAVWTDTTAGDFTTALSIGKTIVNGVSLGTGLTINAYTGDTPQTGDSYARIGALGAGLTGITNVTLAATQTGVTIPTVTTVTNQLTAAAIAAGVWRDIVAGDFTVSGSIGASLGGAFTALGTPVYSTASLANAPTAPTAAQVATAVWQDTTAGDFTVASSIGKSLYTSGVVPGGSGGLFIAGSNAATTVNITGNLSGSVGSVTGAVGSVTGAVGSVTGNVGGSVASVTGNVGGNVTGSVGSVVGNVGGNVVGSVASVGAAVLANVTQINSSTIAAVQLALSAQSICSGVIGTGSTTTSFVTSSIANPASLSDSGQLIGRTIIFLGVSGNSGHVQAQATNITSSSTGSTPTIGSTNALTTAPVSGDLFVVL